MKHLPALLLGSLATYLLMRRALRDKDRDIQLIGDLAHHAWKAYQQALADSE